MPIYEYRCSACGAEREFLQKLSDPPMMQCPTCSQPTLVKVMSAAGFQLKGSGWYVTDFRNGSKPPAKAAGASTPNAEGDSKASAPAAAEQASKDGASRDGASKEGASKEGASKEGASKERASKSEAAPPARPAGEPAA